MTIYFLGGGAVPIAAVWSLAAVPRPHLLLLLVLLAPWTWLDSAGDAVASRIPVVSGVALAGALPKA